MPVTLADIKRQYPAYTYHPQIGNKQLFICSGYTGLDTADNHNKILVSYRTIVGFYDAVLGTWALTKQCHSVTTTKQLTQFARGRNVTWLDSL